MRVLNISGGVACFLLVVSGQATASSDWDDFFAEVTARCVAASSVKRPRPSVIIDVGTDDNQVAMLVLDRARGSNRAELCVYNKRSRKASVGAADLWSAPSQADN